MPRYVAFLRGVSPTNLKMSDLKSALEDAGFTAVKTVMASGNVAFDGRAATRTAIEKKVTEAILKKVKHGFLVFVRRTDELLEWIDGDPFAKLDVPAGAKRIVTLLHDAPSKMPDLPIEFEEAGLLAHHEGIVLGAYVPRQNDPAFMRLIEKTFGKKVTTRTWDSFCKCANS